MRALWERTNEELKTLPLPARPIASALFSHLRTWDAVTASRVQKFVANSTATRNRIQTYYRRDSDIVFPPIDTKFFSEGESSCDYYLVASRPVPYKRVDLAIDATALIGRSLKIVGGGHAFKAVPRNVELLGHVSDERLRDLMRGARALLFPQYEDFGMAPLETNACGRPVIAFGAGGALDTVIDGVTGILAPEQSVESFAEAIRRFETSTFESSTLRQHAEQFSMDRFQEAFRSVRRQSGSHHVIRQQDVDEQYAFRCYDGGDYGACQTPWLYISE
jgi:glycosyltransferase involved in cell wall biosynthesis